MATSRADIDGSDSHEAVRQAHEGTKPVLPDGWWDGSASAPIDYWRRRAEAAEARCKALAAELAEVRRAP